VYNPSEDTFLLLNTIDVSSKDTVFEIGSGTGIIALMCAQKGASVLCSDINPYAVSLVQKNIKQNKKQLTGSIEIRQGSLFSVIEKLRHRQFSLIIFNPPYLPTSSHEYIGGSGWFDKAVSGGKTGLKITKQFVTNLPKHLTQKGRAFTIVSSQSPRDEFNTTLKKLNLKSIIVATQKFTHETIEVHKISKK